MAEAPRDEPVWEVLTLRSLAATDERAEDFTGTLVIHRRGSGEPVETVSVSIRRTIVAELHETLGRLLARSIGLRRGGRPTNR